MSVPVISGALSTKYTDATNVSFSTVIPSGADIAMLLLAVAPDIRSITADVVWDAAGDNITMTQLAAVTGSWGTKIYAYGLTGTQGLVAGTKLITTTVDVSTFQFIVIPFTGVDQTTPWGTVLDADGTGSAGYQAVSGFTASVDEYVLSAGGHGGIGGKTFDDAGGTYTPILFQNNSGTAGSYVCLGEANTTVMETHSDGLNGDWGLIGLPVIGSSPSGTTTTQTGAVDLNFTVTADWQYVTSVSGGLSPAARFLLGKQ